MLGRGRICPVFGMNRGTVGFLMNECGSTASTSGSDAPAFDGGADRDARDLGLGRSGQRRCHQRGLLLRETVRRAWTRCRSTGASSSRADLRRRRRRRRAGSTAKSSAQGPILPLSSRPTGADPISPFRPWRWRGASMSDDRRFGFELEYPDQRLVRRVANEREGRDVYGRVWIDRTRRRPPSTEHVRDEWIATEQLLV